MYFFVYNGWEKALYTSISLELVRELAAFSDCCHIFNQHYRLIYLLGIKRQFPWNVINGIHRLIPNTWKVGD